MLNVPDTEIKEGQFNLLLDKLKLIENMVERILARSQEVLLKNNEYSDDILIWELQEILDVINESRGARIHDSDNSTITDILKHKNLK